MAFHFVSVMLDMRSVMANVYQRFKLAAHRDLPVVMDIVQTSIIAQLSVPPMITVVQVV